MHVFDSIFKRKYNKTIEFTEKVEVFEILCASYCPHNMTLLHFYIPELQFAHRTSKVLLWAFGLSPRFDRMTTLMTLSRVPERGRASTIKIKHHPSHTITYQNERNYTRTIIFKLQPSHTITYHQKRTFNCI